MDMFLTRGSWYGQANVCCVTLENNIFWPSERINNGGVHFYSVLVHDNADSIDRYKIRNNRFDLPLASAATRSSTPSSAATPAGPSDGGHRSADAR